jgi:hypothetical protein
MADLKISAPPELNTLLATFRFDGVIIYIAT